MKMKKVQKKLDLIFNKAGEFNRYQFIIVTLFTFQYICSQFFHSNFSYLTARPFIVIDNKEKRIDPDICEKHFNGINSTDSMIFGENKIPTTSIILDFELYCKAFKTYLINILYFVGIIIGAFTSYNFYDNIGAKLTLGIFIPTEILSQILFQLLNLDKFKNNIYILYLGIFCLGLSENIVINNLFLYMCDITNVSDIPIFMTFIINGKQITFLLGVFFFNIFDLNWKTDLLIIAGIDIFIFIFILIYMVNSPKAALRNKKYVDFIKYILKIAEKNKKKIEKENFDFLMLYMSNAEKVEYENLFNTHKYSKDIIKDDDNEDLDNINQKDKFQNENVIEPLLPIEDGDKKNKNLKNNNNLKEEYLLNDDNNKVGSVKSLFGKTKVKDYSPLDLFKHKSQLINFSILCFLWAVYNFIKYGLDSTTIKILEYNSNIYWGLCTHCIDMFSLYSILLIYMSKKISFIRLLISIQLMTFIILLFAMHFDDKEFSTNIYIFFIVLAQICWKCLYLLLILITLLIYPIMLRSKGLGWNIAFGTFGRLFVMFFEDLINEDDYILYFLIFDFFLLVVAFGLPKKIGDFVLDLRINEKKSNSTDDDDNKSIKVIETK